MVYIRASAGRGNAGGGRGDDQAVGSSSKARVNFIGKLCGREQTEKLMRKSVKWSGGPVRKASTRIQKKDQRPR